MVSMPAWCNGSHGALQNALTRKIVRVRAPSTVPAKTGRKMDQSLMSQFYNFIVAVILQRSDF